MKRLASAWRVAGELVGKSEESPNDDEMCGQLRQSREQLTGVQRRSDNVRSLAKLQ